MKYLGGKQRLAKYFLPIILKHRLEGQYWVEPFVGGGNVIDKVTGPRIGYDINPYTVAALKYIRDEFDSIPKNNKEFTEEDYKRMREGCKKEASGLCSYAGYAFSFGANWYTGFARDKKGNRDYIKSAYRAASEQTKRIQGVNFSVSSFNDIYLPKKSLIYCDPPYRDRTGYRNSGDFNHNVFWEWVIDKANQGHSVFVSELVAPESDAIRVVWEKERYLSVRSSKNNKVVEKLFHVLPSQGRINASNQ